MEDKLFNLLLDVRQMGCLHSKTANLPSSDDPSAPNKPESGNNKLLHSKYSHFVCSLSKSADFSSVLVMGLL